MNTFISIVKQFIKKGVFQRSQLFYRYLASYFFIFFLPILILSFLVFSFISTYFESEVIENNYTTINHIKNTVDGKIDELYRVTYQILYNSDISSYTFTGDPLKGMQVIRFLKNLTPANKFIHEVILYTGESNLLLSSTGSYTISNFTGSIYKYANWTQQEFIEDLDKSTNVYFRSAESVSMNSEPKRFITGIFPDNMNPRSVIFLIDENSMLQILNTFRGNIVVIDSNNIIIASTAPKSSLHSKEFSTFIQSDKLSDYTILTLENVNYFVSYTRSENTEWTYVALMPVEEVMGNLEKMQLAFMYSLVIIFIIGSIIILFVTRFNYNPIKQLRTFAETRYGNSISVTNELDAVKFSIDSISESNAELQEKIRISHPALKDFMLTSFLKGNFKDINDFNIAAKEAGLCFTKSFYFIAIILIADLEQYTNSKDNIASELEINLPKGLEGYCKNNFEDNKLIMILTTDVDNVDIKMHMQKLQKYLEDQWGIYCTIGVSRRCNNIYISHIWQSYIEASTALDYRLIYGNTSVILFNDISLKKNDSSFCSSQTLESLSLCIKNADYERVCLIIDELVQRINENCSLFTARCLCFDIINTLMRSVYDINKSFAINDNEALDLLSLMKFESVEDLASTVKSFCFDIYEYVKTIKTEDNQQLFTAIKSYVDMNCCNLDFSLQATADHFRMSLSNLGHYFKSHTGITLSEHISSMQIEKAKELLRNTNEPIQGIVKQVGHYDASNFIRKFKQLVGMTPGEYRKYMLGNNTDT